MACRGIVMNSISSKKYLTNEFKNQIKDGESLDKLLPEAFALD